MSLNEKLIEEAGKELPVVAEEFWALRDEKPYPEHRWKCVAAIDHEKIVAYAIAKGAECDRMREDAMRIDWMETKEFTSYRSSDKSRFWVEVQSDGISKSRCGENLREAMDLARQDDV